MLSVKWMLDEECNMAARLNSYPHSIGARIVLFNAQPQFLCKDHFQQFNTYLNY